MAIERKQDCYDTCLKMGYKQGSAEYRACVRECEKKNLPDNGEEDTEYGYPGAGPCTGAGYLGSQSKMGDKYILHTPCKAGHKPVKGADGRIWCCEKPKPGTEEEDGTEEGTVDESCYRLADKPVAAEGGKIWTDELITAEMGFYRNPNAQGHWLHKNGKWYLTKDVKDAIRNNTLGSLQGTEGGACMKGYKRTMKEGEAYCCPAEASTQPGAEAAPGGEFAFSPELLAAIRQMLERYEEILDRPYGLTDEERQDIINYAVKGVRAGERGRKQSKIDQLARIGMLGQPIEIAKMGEIERETRAGEADIRGMIGIEGINRKMQDFLTTTGMSAEILKLLMETERLPEILSGSRRREGLDWTALLTNYLGQQMGAGSNYWQMLFNMMNQGGGGSILDYLPYLGYYLGNRMEM